MSNTIKLLFGILILWVLVLIYGVSQALAPRVKIEMTPRPKGMVYKFYLDILAAQDNKNGTSTLIADACGSILKFTVDNKAIEQKDEEVSQIIQEAMNKACVN